MLLSTCAHSKAGCSGPEVTVPRQPIKRKSISDEKPRAALPGWPCLAPTSACLPLHCPAKCYPFSCSAHFFAAHRAQPPSQAFMVPTQLCPHLPVYHYLLSVQKVIPSPLFQEVFCDHSYHDPSLLESPTIRGCFGIIMMLHTCMHTLKHTYGGNFIQYILIMSFPSTTPSSPPISCSFSHKQNKKVQS